MRGGTCKLCGEPISWEWTGRKWRPVNPDGMVHFPTCRENVAQGRERVRKWYDEEETRFFGKKPVSGGVNGAG